MADSPQAREPRFKVGDRVAYKNFNELTLGTVTRVQRNGYRIAWDDGYRDLAGPQGVYPEDDFVAEGEPYDEVTA